MTAQGQCREDDTTLVIDNDTEVTIEHVSLSAVPEHRRGVDTTMDTTEATFSGSFSVEFEDADDALEFWEWLHESV